LAKSVGDPSGPTHTGDVLGTPSYMAPEQAAGKVKEINPASEVYALGAVLYEMLTGRPPFKGESTTATLLQVLQEEPVAPSRFRARLPRDLETVCLKCLRKEPGKRYPTAQDLADDLERFLDGQPITARPVTLWERGLKWARRRPAVAALLAVTTTAAFLLGLILLGQHAREHRRQAHARLEVEGLLERGTRALGGQDWKDAGWHLEAALARIDSEPSLADLRPRAEEMRAEAGQRQRALDTDRQFVSRRDEALFLGMNSRGTLLAGLDGAAQRLAAEAAARRALDLMGLDLDGDAGWEPDPCFRDPARRAELTTDCYTLLLVLADLVAHRDPPGPERYREALRVVARASRLRPPTRAYHLRRAHYLEQLGDGGSARRERRAAAAVPLVTALDFFLIGDERYRRGDLDGAVRVFEDAVGVQPGHFWAQHSLAYCYLVRQQWDKARSGLTVCLALRPDFVWPHLMRGFAHRELRAFVASESDFRRAEDLLAHQPTREARYVLHLNRGLLRLMEGRLDESADDFRQALRLRPDDYAPYLNLARVCRRQDRPDEAARLFEHALSLRPPDLVVAGYHGERGRDLYDRGDYEGAVAQCRAALARRPDYAYAHAVLGLALLKLQRPEQAARAFDRYLQCGGRPLADVYRGRGTARVRLGDYLGARDDYARALELQPGDAELYAHRGWAYFFADSWRPALADFQRALELRAGQADAWVGSGLARVMLGQYREAVGDADEALRRRPDTPEMMLNLACLFAQAAVRAEADAAGPGREALAGRYRERALKRIGQALALLRPEERPLFWREKIAPDHALDPIRSCPEFRKWAGEYDQAGPRR
jgi:tetratricopeptide (TPR) repeat protein